MIKNTIAEYSGTSFKKVDYCLNALKDKLNIPLLALQTINLLKLIIRGDFFLEKAFKIWSLRLLLTKIKYPLVSHFTYISSYFLFSFSVLFYKFIIPFLFHISIFARTTSELNFSSHYYISIIIPNIVIKSFRYTTLFSLFLIVLV